MALGHIPLVKGTTTVKVGTEGNFEIPSSTIHGPRTYYLKASSNVEAKEWEEAITSIVNGKFTENVSDSFLKFVTL